MRKQDIFDHIAVDSGSGCWNWTRARNRAGYGVCHIPNWALAHRVAYALAKGPIPSGKHVCHTCDNPACINPDHLWVGTHADNMADKEAKGRGTKPPIRRGKYHWRNRYPERVKRGEESPTSRLTAADVIGIRLAYVKGVPIEDIANAFGISPASVPDYITTNDDMTTFKAWGHVTDGPSVSDVVGARRTTPGAKITRDTADEIRRRLDGGETGRALAAEYGITAATVSDIKLRKTWR